MGRRRIPIIRPRKEPLGSARRIEKNRPAVRRHTPISNPSVWRTRRSAGTERKSLRFRCHLTGTPFQLRGPNSLVMTEVSWPSTRSACARSPKYLHGCRFSSAGGSVAVMIAIRRASKDQPAPLHRTASEPGMAGIRLNRLNNLGTVPRRECPRGPSPASLHSGQFGSVSCATARRSRRGTRGPSRNCFASPEPVSPCSSFRRKDRPTARVPGASSSASMSHRTLRGRSGRWTWRARSKAYRRCGARRRPKTGSRTDTMNPTFAGSVRTTWISSSNAGSASSMAKSCTRRAMAHGRFSTTTNSRTGEARRVAGTFTTGTRSRARCCSASPVASAAASHSEPGTFGRPSTPFDKTLTRCISGWRDGRPTCVKTSAWARPRTWRALRPLRRSPRRAFLRTVRRAIELPVHASYPYLVVERGEIYCIPETNASREIGLYRAIDFPTRWEKVGTLVSGVAALDPTVFRHEGRWWLTCTDREVGENMPLFVWHARNLEGPWEPHALNPVKADIRSSRPAGTPFVDGGILYRPAQDCSRMYGGGIVINRVVRLTPTEFMEEPAATIEPFSESPFPDGIHTLSGVGDITLIDSKRHRFVPSAIPYVLRNRPVPGRDRATSHPIERR